MASGNGNRWYVDSTGHKLYIGATAADVPASATQSGTFTATSTPWRTSALYSAITEIEVLDGQLKRTSCANMFNGFANAASIDVSMLDTSSVTTMYAMFYNCSSLTSIDVSHFDTSKVTTMQSVFTYCSSLTSLDLSNFDTSAVTTMQSMFQACSSLTSLDLSNFDTSAVTTIYDLFSGCSSLTSLDVSNFDTSKVTTMYAMFQGCSSLTSLDVSGFDTSSVTTMYQMFRGCSSLTSLSLPDIPASVGSVRDMFYLCNALTSLTCKSGTILRATGTMPLNVELLPETTISGSETLASYADTIAAETFVGSGTTYTLRLVGTISANASVYLTAGYNTGIRAAFGSVTAGTYTAQNPLTLTYTFRAGFIGDSEGRNYGYYLRLSTGTFTGTASFMATANVTEGCTLRTLTSGGWHNGNQRKTTAELLLLTGANIAGEWIASVETMAVAGKTIMSKAATLVIEGNEVSGTENHVAAESHTGTESHSGAETHTGTESHSGAVTLTGTEDHQGTETHSGGETHTGAETHSGTVNLTGTVQMGGTTLTPSAAEINHLTGVTSGIQSQIDSKNPTISALTVDNFGSVSIASGTPVTLGDVTLDEGLYIINGSATYANDSTGYRQVGLVTGTVDSSTLVYDLDYAYCDSVRASTNSATVTSFTALLEVTAQTTYHLIGRQTSGSALSCQARVYYVKLK